MDKVKKDRAKHTRSTYDALVASYAQAPAKHLLAAAHAGVSRDMARRAWQNGFPGIAWAPPIRERVAAEADDAASVAERAREERVREAERRRALEDADREKARAERVRSIAEELQIQSAMRGSVRQAAGVVLAMTPAMNQLVRVVMLKLFDETTGLDGKPVYTPKPKPDVDVMTAMSIISRWASLMGKFTQAGAAVVQLGRETRGPEERAGAPTMSPEEAREELEHLNSIWEGIKAREQAEREEQEGDPPPRTRLQ